MEADIRHYTPADRAEVRMIFSMDEFARPRLLQKYPLLSEYLADEMSYYPEYEPESMFVAEIQGQVVGVLCGAIDTNRFERVYNQRVRPYMWLRGFTGAYGWPGWLPAVIRTEWAERDVIAPRVDRLRYPAHLHIGILPEWRRQGIGTSLMNRFADYLQSRAVPGYHLYASSYHWMGVAFYRKLGLELLGQFDWRLHTGFEWMNVNEQIYGRSI